MWTSWRSTVHRKPGHMLDSDAVIEKGIIQFVLAFLIKLIHTAVD
jgi:hypothetical protein